MRYLTLLSFRRPRNDFEACVKADIFHGPDSLHRYLCKAFPRYDRGVDELSRRSGDASKNLLFCADGDNVIIQSAVPPDVDRLVTHKLLGYTISHRNLLAAEPKICEYHPSFTDGQELCFLLKASPTCCKRDPSRRRFRKKKSAELGSDVYQPVRCRKPILDDFGRIRWFENKGRGSFHSLTVHCERIPSVTDKHRELREGKPCSSDMVWNPVCYTGKLRVIDPQVFWQQICNGFGPSKAFGFGLMMLPELFWEIFHQR